jgi:hypothetical protein
VLCPRGRSALSQKGRESEWVVLVIFGPGHEVSLIEPTQVQFEPVDKKDEHLQQLGFSAVREAVEVQEALTG